MGVNFHRPISRREFIRYSALGLAGISGTGFWPDSLFASDQTAVAPTIIIEPHPVVKVLRWKAFVQNEADIWLANTRRWEKLTGGRVITDFLPWEDVRPKAAMEATIGTGHDLVLGWYDDPHLYPHSLVDLTDLAEYLGKKYGGWYPVCETYGRYARTGKWIALPIGCAGVCINYRKSWVREAGFDAMPDDIEGFLKCCKAMKSKGHPTGFALGHSPGDPNTWSHWWLWSFGGKTVEPDGRTIAINSKETLMALDAARELFETMTPGVEKWLDADNNEAFLAGRISVTNNGSSIAYAAKASYPEIDADLEIMNFPVGPVGRPAELSLLSQAFIFNHCPAPEAARHYLLFMFEAEQYAQWIGNSWGYVTQSLNQFYDLPAWKENSRITPYRQCMNRMLPNGHAGPLGKASAAAMSDHVVVDMIADACLGKKTPKNAALSAEKKLARLYQAR